MARRVAWFSSGAASAVAAKIAIEEHPDTIVVRCIVKNEHEDNDRFAKDVSKWLGKEIIELSSDKYTDCWDVWFKTRYLNGPAGARCTVELKKKLRQQFQQPDDIQVFGFTKNEKERAKRFAENNPEVNADFPLIRKGRSKKGCFRTLQKAGIELPAMYKLGYANANCVGCVKGGIGYWNKIRRDFPEIFHKMAEFEVWLGSSCINGIFLKDLDPEAGRHRKPDLPSCGMFCGDTINDEDVEYVQLDLFSRKEINK